MKYGKYIMEDFCLKLEVNMNFIYFLVIWKMIFFYNIVVYRLILVFLIIIYFLKI